MIRFLLLSVLTFAPIAEAAKCKATSLSDFAKAISRGHAYAKHVVKEKQFVKGKEIAGVAYPKSTVTSKAEFAARIEAAMRHGVDKELRNRRHAYWDAATGVVVITNRNAGDCGTAFRPDRGRRYYDNLK